MDQDREIAATYRDLNRRMSAKVFGPA